MVSVIIFIGTIKMNVSNTKKVRVLSDGIEFDAFTKDNESYFGIDGNPVLNTRIIVIGNYKKPGFVPEFNDSEFDDITSTSFCVDIKKAS